MTEHAAYAVQARAYRRVLTWRDEAARLAGRDTEGRDTEVRDDLDM